MIVEDIRTAPWYRDGGTVRRGVVRWRQDGDSTSRMSARSIHVAVDRTAGTVSLLRQDGNAIPSAVWRTLVDYIEAITTGYAEEASG